MQSCWESWRADSENKQQRKASSEYYTTETVQWVPCAALGPWPKPLPDGECHHWYHCHWLLSFSTRCWCCCSYPASRKNSLQSPILCAISSRLKKPRSCAEALNTEKAEKASIQPFRFLHWEVGSAFCKDLHSEEFPNVRKEFLTLGSWKSQVTDIGILAYSGKNGPLSTKPSVLWRSALKQSEWWRTQVFKSPAGPQFPHICV